jgi:hypothetical protein
MGQLRMVRLYPEPAFSLLSISFVLDFCLEFFEPFFGLRAKLREFTLLGIACGY